uniref:ATP synthase CF0 B subunit subunit I n=5 Tax=Habenaria TaxID=38204 RepID=A0A8A1RXX0_9ASPA|nr:ATPase subunit I [Habenaria radiata]YP_010230046.1 ATP synthase CF0 B subunit subunit I [Habenaria cruciformis]YP_010230131.1 ATP synthase CF0 B subunit subunit I [Habenaria linearifolia]ASU93447.1 ATPase subunit I [Habenaria radiata]QST19928.1 ATP synthase CF0 B subunit subunit I [Habenaria cruciformis]QST20013.1 ATP synthase CF0 B subunit subunit I [Habenaria linearifolia]
MINITDSFVSMGHRPSVGSFEFNTDILATNPINLSVVLGVLIFFGKGVCASCVFQKRKQKILSTIRNSEELRRGAIEQFERARARLRKVKMEADEYRTNGYSEIEREKVNLINATLDSLKRLENFKNETILFEQQRAINQVRQQFFQQALKRALRTLNSCLNSELHFRTISDNIGILGSVE